MALNPGTNTLTNLIPNLYAAMDVVSRELVGAIPTITLDADFTRAAVGQTVYSFQTPSATATDITPGVTPPNDGDQTINNVSMTITKARRVPFRWAGEQTLQMNSGGMGPGFQNIRNDQIVQAIRTLVNEMEADVVAAIRAAASRAYGTAGTAPFASSLGDSAQVRKILDDNGAPMSNRSLIIDTSAGASLRTLGQLTKLNESGTLMTMRDGELLNLHGFSIHESGQIAQITAGTATLFATSTAGFAVGATSIAVTTGASTGACSLSPGDVVSFASDTANKYVVAVALTLGASASGTLVIAAPGLKKAIPASAQTITVAGNFTPNVAYSKNAVVLATRAPALPDGGDLAADRMMITDPRSGISFEVAMYPQYRQMQYEISACWGVKDVKPEHTALLLG